jgi:hypothetical protein
VTRLRPWPRIRIYHNQPVRLFDADAPAARSVAARKRIGADLVHVVTTRLARANRGLDCFDLGDVDNGLLSVLADGYSGFLQRIMPRPVQGYREPPRLPGLLNAMSSLSRQTTTSSRPSTLPSAWLRCRDSSMMAEREGAGKPGGRVMQPPGDRQSLCRAGRIARDASSPIRPQVQLGGRTRPFIPRGTVSGSRSNRSHQGDRERLTTAREPR